MPIEERLGEQGSFAVEFEGIPDEVYRRIDHYDHIVVVHPKVDLDLIADPLPLSEYTGVILEKDLTAAPRIRGAGLIRHLGDEDNIADTSEADIVLFNDTLEDAIAQVLPPAIVPGTIHSQAPKTITARFPGLQETPRQQLAKLMTEFGTEYRITPQGYLDAGTAEQLYETTTNPKCILLPRTTSEGQDPTMKSIAISEALQRYDRRGYATRTILAAQNEADSTIAVASADLAAPTTFRDLHGNELVRKKIISESSTDGGLAPTRALAHLAAAAGLRRELSISTEDYEPVSVGDTGPGSYRVGETVWAYDPLSDLQDPANEVMFRGERWQPTTIRIVGTDRPIPRDSSVIVRHKDGTYTDVTDWIIPEDGPTQITVGAFGRPLVGDPNEQLGPRITADASVPAIPVFSPFVSSVYQDDNGVDRGSITASWSTPANTDGTAVVDGATYTIGWKRAGTGVYQFLDVPWGTNTVMIQDLPIAVSFDFIIQASDAAKPPNRSGFSAVSAVVAGTDITAPGTPAAPTVAGGILQIRILHTLGLASGGTFNLDGDLDHLNVYADTSSGFTPGPGNFKGAIVATKTHMALGMEVLGDFDMDDDTARWVKVTAVDHSGNESVPSAAATATAELIQDQHVGNISVGKLTAGTVSVSVLFTATHVIGGIVETAASGQRVALEEGDEDRIKLYTGDASETAPGNLRSLVVGSGSSRFLNLIMEAPKLSGAAHYGQAAAFSGSPDASTTGSAELRVFDVSTSTLQALVRVDPTSVSGWLGSPSTGRRWVLAASAASLLYGTTSQPALVMVSNAIELRRQQSGRSVLLDDVSVSMAYEPSGRRVRVNDSRVIVVGSDNVDRFDIRDDQINAWRGLALNSWELWTAAAGGVARLSGGSNPILDGVGACQMRASADDVTFMVGSAFAEAAVMNPALTDYRHLQVNILTYDALILRSDRRLKDDVRELDPRECVDLLVGTPASGFNLKSNPDQRTWGFVAQDVPEIARRTSQHPTHGEVLTYDPTVMATINWAATQEILRRLAALEDPAGGR